MVNNPKITASKVQVYTVPTDAPEADGTIAWDSTTMVLVTIDAGGKRGIGYTYADAATGKLVKMLLEKIVEGRARLRSWRYSSGTLLSGPQLRRNRGHQHGDLRD